MFDRPRSRQEAKKEVVPKLLEEHVKFKKILGNFDRIPGPPDTRDAVIDFSKYGINRTRIAISLFIVRPGGALRPYRRSNDVDICIRT